MRTAIVTKVIPATNHKPTRVKATAHDVNGKPTGSAIVSWDYGQDVEGMHALAAREAFGAIGDGWSSRVRTSASLGTGYVFIVESTRLA